MTGIRFHFTTDVTTIGQVAAGFFDALTAISLTTIEPSEIARAERHLVKFLGCPVLIHRCEIRTDIVRTDLHVTTQQGLTV